MKKYKKLIACIIVLIIFILITLLIKKYFKPFFTIVIIFYLAHPLYNFFCKHKIFPYKINAVVSILFINTIFLLIIVLIGNFILRNINVFKIQYLFTKNNFNIPNFSNIIDIKGFLVNIKNMIYNIYNNQLVKKSASYTIERLLAYFMGNLMVYFILTDKNTIETNIKIMITENNYNIIKNKFITMSNILRIEICLVIITTIETILGFFILKIQHPLVLGIMCGILDIMPYIGTIIVFIPLTLYKIYNKQYIIGIGLIILYIFLAINRQILETKFMSSKFKIHPLATIISFYIGVKFFGLIGMFMGPLYLLTVKEVILS